jgi:hypothetical protein
LKNNLVIEKNELKLLGEFSPLGDPQKKSNATFCEVMCQSRQADFEDFFLNHQI